MMKAWQALLASAGGLLAMGAVGRWGRTSTVGGTTIRGGTMYGPGGLTYRLTEGDLLWLGRALIGEASTTEARQAVAWAIAQNFMEYIGPTGRPRFGTFTRLLCAYCQPINPKWARGGSGCVSSPRNCSETALNRRERITAMSAASFPSSVKTIIRDFRAGTLYNPVPSMSDWHASNWQSSSKVPTVNIGGNWFGVKNYMRRA